MGKGLTGYDNGITTTNVSFYMDILQILYLIFSHVVVQLLTTLSYTVHA